MKKLILLSFLFLGQVAWADGYSPFGDQHWKAPVATSGALPTSGNAAGDTRIVLSPIAIYEWSGSSWQNILAANAVVGPGSSTDKALARWNGTTGNTLSNSAATLSDAGVLTVPNILDSGLSASQAVVSDSSKNLTSLAYGSSSAASTLVQRDSSQNSVANNWIPKGTSVSSGGTTTTLTAASALLQQLTGSSAQTFQLPDATTLSVGWPFHFSDNSTGALTVKDGGGTTIFTVPSGGDVVLWPISVGTTAGSWDWHFLMPANASYGTAGLTITGTIAASNLSGSSSGTNTGDVTLGAVGSAPSANAASLSGQVLTLQPADGTHPGVETTGTQTIAGAKTFSTSLTSPAFISSTANVATAGALRLANADAIDIRNAANGANIAFGAGSSDAIPAYGSVDLANISTAQTLTNKTISPASNTITKYAWSGYHQTDCDFTTTSNTFADFAADATCTFTEQVNLNFGTVSSQTSAGNKVPGIVFTPPIATTYKVCAYPTVWNDTGAAVTSIRLRDETNSVTIAEGENRMPSAGGNISQTTGICGLWTSPGTSSTTISLQGAASAGTSHVTSKGGPVTGDLYWVINLIF